MPFSVEGFGEKVLGFFERIYVLVLDLLIYAVSTLKPINKKAGDIDRRLFYPFFEKRGIEPNDYTVFKLQLTSVSFLIVTVLYVINALDARRYILTGALFLVFSVYILFSTVKRDFKEYAPYKDLYLSFYLLLLLLAAIKVKKPYVSVGFPFFHFAAVAVLGVLVIYARFNQRYSRDFTYGKVKSVKGQNIEVKFNYDICSNVKPQTVILNNNMNAREGDVVKVRVVKGIISIKGAAPVEVIAVEWS